jgi:very-short-patch-repair endonuclease
MSVQQYNKEKYKAQREFFEKEFLSWKSCEEIEFLYKKGITPLQLTKLYRYEVGLESFLAAVFIYRSDKKSQIKSLWTAKPSALALKNMLIRVVPYSKEYNKIHLSLPQWEKIRFDYLDKSEEEVKELALKSQQKWQSETIKQRKKRKFYCEKLDPQFYISSNLASTVSEAKILIKERSIKNSPMNVGFWIDRGFDENEALKKISSFGAKGAHAALKSTLGKNKSKLEQRIFDSLKIEGLEQQLFFGPYSYDMADRKNKKIIEINGTFWHADPRVYKEDEVLLSGLNAKSIWERDEIKIKYAEQRGWQVLTIWELDWCSNPSEVIKTIKSFIT